MIPLYSSGALQPSPTLSALIDILIKVTSYKYMYIIQEYY